jgi:hypothetical protein
MGEVVDGTEIGAHLEPGVTEPLDHGHVLVAGGKDHVLVGQEQVADRPTPGLADQAGTGRAGGHAGV